MDPNPNDFPLLCYLLNQLDPHTYSPLPKELHQPLLTQFPHLNHPKVLPSLTTLLPELNITNTLSLLSTIGPRPDPSALATSRAKIAEPHVDDDVVQVYQALLRVEEMHVECAKQLKAAEERVVEAYESCVAQSVKGDEEEGVNERVVGILRKAEVEQVEKVDLSGLQLRILPDAFGKIHGLVVLNLSSNQLEVSMVFLSIYLFNNLMIC